MDVYQQLSDSLQDGTLVAFLGAAVSMSYTSIPAGLDIPGLMSGKDIVEDLAERRNYIDSNMTFTEACFLYKKSEGRIALERYLQENIDRPAVRPLPAHVILASIPFSSYVTTNYDRLLENALLDSRRNPFPIIEDEDVSRLLPSAVPVIKLHGCVTRPVTMIACEDEYKPLSEKSPIIEALLKTQLANKTILFLGYSLDDSDFKTTYNMVKKTLGNHMPKSYAIIKSATSYQKELWSERGIKIIEDDLTQYLRGLLRKSIEAKLPPKNRLNEDWVNNIFFESLHKIRTSPSETQAIDAFFDHLLKEVQSPAFVALSDVLDRAEKAATTVLNQKVNFEAFKKSYEAATHRIKNDCTTKEEAEDVLMQLMDEREQQSFGLRRQWSKIVGRGDNLLTYSQSVRVAEIFKGAPKGVQDTCQIYIAECRPKSPVSFQDAFAITDNLFGTGYQMTLIPDACIDHLLARHQIDKILLGAHAIHLYDGRPMYFINTCGSSQLVASAVRYNVPVFVVAETSKFIEMSTEEYVPNPGFEEEVDVFEDIAASISEIKSRGTVISTLNIGYDLCKFEEGVFLLSEDGLCGE